MMKISDSIKVCKEKTREHLDIIDDGQGKDDKKVLHTIYSNHEYAREKLELEKLRAEIDAIMAKAERDRAGASRS